MSKTQGDPGVLVVTGDRSLGSAVADAVEATGRVTSADHVETVADALTRSQQTELEGAVVDDQIAEPAAAVEQLADDCGLSVTLLADPGENGSTVSRAIKAGATDVFPRTATNAQYQLLVDRLVDGRDGASSTADGSAQTGPYHEIFQSASDGLVVHEPESGEILEVNKSYCEMTGFDRAELVGETVGLVTADLPGYSPERAKTLINRSREQGQILFEWRNRHRDGSIIPVEVSLTLVDVQGEERVVASVRDITERKRREREYEQVFNEVNDAIAIFDPEPVRFVEVNSSYLEMFGYDDIDAIRKQGIEGLSATDEGYTDEEARQLIRQVDETGANRTVEWCGETREGERFWMESTLAPAEIDGEQRVLSIQRDITERKRREQEFQQIFEGVEDAIVVWDPDTMALLDANEAYLEMLGYDDLAAVRERGVGGLSVTEAGYTEKRGQEIHQRVQATGEPEMVEWQGETATGEQIWLEVKVTPAVIGGEQRTVSIQRDITERKRREQMVRSLHDATDRLQRAETPAETCRATVKVVQEALDLPVAGFWLHRETDDGPVLEPVAETDAVRDLEPLWFEPGDNEYEVFREGTVQIHDPSEQFPENPLDASIMLPVGEHGLLAAGAVGVESYDEFVVDAARTLAGHARTALDRVEREQAIRESERRFRMIAERIDEVIYLGRPDFSEVLYVNPAYGRTFGQSTETLYDDATAFLDVIDRRDRASFESDFEAMLSDVDAGDPDESYEFEFRVRQPDGEVRWVSATGYVMELSGEKRRFVGIVEDVTERKRREQRLQVFNRILRHNLRNQLDVIRSHAEVLADQQTEDHADRIIAAVDELAHMGTRARKSDRLMSVDETPTAVDLAELLPETVEAMTAGHDDIAVTTEFPRSAPLTTSEDAVTVAVESALENALEHAAAGVTVSVQEVSEGYRITVDDDGPGIPEEELVPIETGAETNLRHGRGLGLWQLRWSVDRLNGELSFDTTGGTTVQITIPDRGEPAQTA